MNERNSFEPSENPIITVIKNIVKLMQSSVKGFIPFITLILLTLFIWFGCRIEPGPDKIAVLIQKTGKDLTSGEILALSPKHKGIQKDVLPEGRYFRNPYIWSWEIHRVTDIPAGKLGVKTRLYGKELPPDKIIAEEGTKGIMAEVLRPGKYRINPYAYNLEQFNAITIRPGHVGIIISLTGQDVLSNDIPTDRRNKFLVENNMKGVLPEVIDPGTYYLNPYLVNVIEVNLQSQRFEMSGKDVISFLTLDGFTVTVEGTIEFALDRGNAALLTHKVGDMDDIVKKVILPRARGFSRIEGSKHPAINFIIGESRQEFQNDLESHLREKCQGWGVDVKSVLVRKIFVPDQIASISRDREVAVQDARKYEQQIEQARSKAELVKQEMLAQQNKERVESDTARIRAVINAKQEQEVQIIAARKDLDVAKVDYEAAAFQAEAIELRAGGERDAIHVKNAAEAAVLTDQVNAFETGLNFSRYTFYKCIAPKIGTILTTDEKEGLGNVFTPFILKDKEVSK